MKIRILFTSIILSLLFINAKAAEKSILDVKDNDFYIGEENAPITIIEYACLLYTSPSPRDNRVSRMPSSA